MTETIRPRGTDSARVIKVIVTESLRGTGTEGDPCRLVEQYWSLDGAKLAECDYCQVETGPDRA